MASYAEAKLNLLLPIICNVLLTAFAIPNSCRKALTYYRAAQVYVRQPLDGDNSQDPATVTPPTSAPRWQLVLMHSLNALLWLSQLFIMLTSGSTYEKSWWIVVSTRQMIPYALMYGLFYSAFWVFFTLYVNPVERLTRTHDAFDTRLPSMWTMEDCDPKKTAEEAKSTSARIHLASLLLSTVTTTACAYTTSGTLVVLTLAATCSYLCSQLMHVWPNLFYRCSVRIHALCLVVMIGALLILALIGVVLFMLIMSFFKNTGLGDKLDKNLPNPELDHVMQQYDTVLDMSMSAFVYLLPGSLLMLAYRIDASTAGETDVDDNDAASCMEESRHFAANLRDTRCSQHAFDKAGRTAVLTDSIKPWQDHYDRPNYRTALITFYVVQAIMAGLYLCTLTGWTTVQFPHSTQEINPKAAYLHLNLPAFVSWVLMIAVLLICAGQRAHSSGQTFASGVRELWSYEEDWFMTIPALPKRLRSGEVQLHEDDSRQDIEGGTENIPLLPVQHQQQETDKDRCDC